MKRLILLAILLTSIYANGQGVTPPPVSVPLSLANGGTSGTDAPSARSALGASKFYGAVFQTGTQNNLTTVLVSSTNCQMVLPTGTFYVSELELTHNTNTTGLSQSQATFSGTATQSGIYVARAFGTSFSSPTPYDQTQGAVNYNTIAQNFGSNTFMTIERDFTLVVTTSGTLSVQFSCVSTSGTAQLYPSSFLKVWGTQ